MFSVLETEVNQSLEIHPSSVSFSQVHVKKQKTSFVSLSPPFRNMLELG